MSISAVSSSFSAASLPYRGRFAPSPTGPLHFGSLVAAMASWLAARSHQGTWLVRIEDLDPPREMPGASADILKTLAAFGFEWDEPVVYQSQRTALYQAAFTTLDATGWLYPCVCTRKEITDSILVTTSHGAIPARPEPEPGVVYPGTCRAGLDANLENRRTARAWRMRIVHPQRPATRTCISFRDRSLGWISQDLLKEVGDFVLKRADGPWAYQLAVVVDDAAQGITEIVRGSDLFDSTARQIHLQQVLQLPTPRYLHVPVVTHTEGAFRGEKLSKQTGASALNSQQPLEELRRAASYLQLPEPRGSSITGFWQQATSAWQARWSMTTEAADKT